jgi:DNA-binding NarL/FixJ family response regulator
MPGEPNDTADAGALRHCVTVSDLDAIPDTAAILTGRQLEIVRLVTHGLTNQEIAIRLEISHNTVKNHLTEVLRRVRLRSRYEVAIWALQAGVIELGDIELQRRREIDEW